MHKTLLALLLLIPIFTGFTTTGTGSIQLGQWTNYPGNPFTLTTTFPNGTQICDGFPGVSSCVCDLPHINTVPSVGDACELFNSPNYRAEIFTNGPQNGLSVGFSLNCINPAIHTNGGSVVYLEYANYSFTTWANVSNFKIVGASIYIDNTNSFPCPGTLANDIGSIPATSSDGYEFRIVAVCGCTGFGSSGNPILNNVQVDMFRSTGQLIGIQMLGFTTAHFLWRAQTISPVTSSTTVTLNWIATNQTSATCGIIAGVNDECIQSGTSTCSIGAGTSACSTVTVTFSHTFTGTVTGTESHTPALTTTNIFFPLQSKVMFAAQTNILV